MTKSKSVSIAQGTRSRKKAEAVRDKTSKKAGEKASPKGRMSSLDRRKKKVQGGNNQPPITPVWIEYYNQQARDPTSAFGKGVGRPSIYFEELMDQFAGSEDNLLEVLKSNPESCAFIYSDSSKHMRIIHHLTAVVHGDALVVGLEGFGGKSPVSVVDGSQFVERITLDPKVGSMTIPSLEAFLSTGLEDIVTNQQVEATSEVEGVTTLHQILSDAPKGFLFHPRWLNIIFPHLGKAPAEMAQSIVQYSRKKVDCDDAYIGDDLIEVIDEFHLLLVYLWACQNGWVSIGGGRSRTYTLEGGCFEKIQGSIVNKIIGVKTKIHVTCETPEDSAVASPLVASPPLPTFNRPPPIQPRGTAGGDSILNKAAASGIGNDDSDDSDSDDSDDDRRKPTKSAGDKRQRKAVSKSRSRSESPHHSRSRSRSERRGGRRRRRSRSDSRDRNRRYRSISPPRYARRRAGETDRKRKTLADKLTEEQLRAFTLLSARDWNDRSPEMSSKMERLLDQTTLSTAIAMFRSEISHGRWKGDLPDSAIAQFLQQGILAIDGETSPSGFSLFFIQPKTYGSKGRCTEQMRKERLSQDFGKGGVSDEAIARLAKLEYHVPRNYEDLVIMVDTGIKWLDFCTGRKSIASRGLRLAASYIEDYRAEIHRIIIRDPHFPIKLIHSLDRSITYVGDKLAYTYRSISEGRYRLEGLMERRLDHHLTGIEECQHNFPAHAIPDDILAIMQDEVEPERSKSKSRDKQSEERPLVPSLKWHTINTHAVDKWKIPKDKEFKDIFGRGSEALKGWPKFDHHITNKKTAICIRYQCNGKCSGKCKLAHVLPTQMSREEFDAVDKRFEEAYK